MTARLRTLIPAILSGSFAAAQVLAAQVPAAQVGAAQVGAAQVGAGQAPAVDWAKQQADSLRHFRALIQIDTSNPPGNEIKAVEYLKKVIEAEGISTQTFALDPNRPNLVARLKGNGSKRPLLILAHTDVVRVQQAGLRSQMSPFGRLLPKSESPIRHFHRLVHDALAADS